jgi:hypothetical protein
MDYQRYLASRGWAVIREKVRKRARNRCERCHNGPMQGVHHLTYERVGAERLDDLQAVCNPCHEFLSAKTDFDPARAVRQIIAMRCQEVNVYCPTGACKTTSETILFGQLGQERCYRCGAVFLAEPNEVADVQAWIEDGA